MSAASRMEGQQIVERERRWAVPAALAAGLPLVLYVISVFVEQSANIDSGGTTVEELRSLQGGSGTVLLAAVIRAIGFLAIPIPMLYLFRAAQARNPRVHPAMVGFVFIGPILLAAQGIVAWAAQDRISSDFAAMGAEPSRLYSKFQSQLKSSPESIEKVTLYTQPHALDVERSDGSFYSASYPPKAGGRIQADLQGAGVDSEVDSEGAPGDPRTDTPGEAVADALVDDSSERQVASGMLFPAVLGLVVMMIYVPLQALRAGLLTRFAGSLGVALGASMILILPVALFASLLWLAYLGLLYVGRAPGGRPPAWETGEAIPWPKPGEEPAAPRQTGRTVEGEATEVGAGDEAAASQGAQAPPGKRKRKRRR